MPTIHENLTILQVDDPLILAEVGRQKAYQQALVAELSDTVAVVRLDRVESVIRLLERLGHHPKVD